jgi:hypothetical protein
MSDFAMVRRPDDPAMESPASSASMEQSESGTATSSIVETMAGGFENAESAMDYFAKSPHLATGVKTFAGLNSGLPSIVASGAEGFEAANAFHEGKTADGTAARQRPCGSCSLSSRPSIERRVFDATEAER